MQIRIAIPVIRQITTMQLIPIIETSVCLQHVNQCHTANPGWKPATLNHNKFPLTLGHAGPTCTECHKNGVYTSTPTDCYACHVNDYNSSVNPGHKALNFSTQCTQCHTTNPDWKPASYTQHDAQFFPIYSGSHRGKWTLCTECHTNPANYQLFDCKRCHTNAHRGKNYTNEQCYACHPRGSWGLKNISGNENSSFNSVI